ncbi:hypothetical protein [Amaricoccus sp.]|uniref:hypothetical protein n=1 Tax=Amaricoccus sp. TaxID=1872485 RepID=UPI001B786C59|nr:hypothetical protein [Amaricoccus sp.]MBP7001701.1 hypothetical protein [Amaricoccus sp.]
MGAETYGLDRGQENRRGRRKLPQTAEALVEGDHGPRVEVEVERRVERIVAAPDGTAARRVEVEVARVNALACGEVEVAEVRTGETVEVEVEGERRVVERMARVNRRRGSPLLATLDPARREAAATFALAVEIVAAGGTSGGGGFVEERVGGGIGAREGRQFQALAWADTLRTLDAAIGGGFVRLNLRGDTIGVRSLICSIAVGGLSIPRILDGLGLKRSAPRERAVKTAVCDALGRMAGALGDRAPVEARRNPR